MKWFTPLNRAIIALSASVNGFIWPLLSPAARLPKNAPFLRLGFGSECREHSCRS